MVWSEESSTVHGEETSSTASNYDSQGTGQTAAESLNHETGESSYSGKLPSLEAAYRVGSTVIHEILGNWNKYEQTVPGA